MTAENDMEKLYQTYYMKIYSYAMTIMKNGGLAEEIAQETFVKAMNGNYNGKSSEFTWLCSITKNLCMDYMRRKKKTTGMPEDVMAEYNVEKKLVDELTSLQIHQVLHTLEEPYKEVFSLRVFGELSFQNIGQIFEKSENWARVTFYRARLKIQERM